MISKILGFPKIWINEWPGWWHEKSLFRKILPALCVALYWGSISLLGDFRGDHLNVGLLVLMLGYGGRQGEILLRFLAPFILTGVVYDSQRYYADYLRGPVHVVEPYQFDKYFFGISTSQGVLTPNEWLQLHTNALLDLFTGFWYLFFFAIFIFLNFYFYFYLGKRGTRKRSAAWISAHTPRMAWAFFWLNILGYSTYYWYAAAPPWYVALYGLGPAKMDVHSNAGGCIRFDELLGTHFFTSMYGRAADVFGAIPSLHVAYPLLALCFAFQIGAARVFTLIFFLSMCFSAVYLNHHYILDILWGSSYAVSMVFIVDWYYNRRERQNPNAP